MGRRCASEERAFARSVKAWRPCASAPFGAAGLRTWAPEWAASSGWTAARRTSPSGCAPATSPSSTTSTSTGSAPTRWSAAASAAWSNAAPSISGRYPNLGPEILINAGIPLLDDVGREVFAAVKEGAHVRLDGNQLLARGRQPSSPRALAHDAATVEAAMTEAKAGLSTQLEAFAANTMEYMKRERALLLDGVGVPDVTHATSTAGTPSSSSAATTTRRTCTRCGPTSATTGRS